MILLLVFYTTIINIATCKATAAKVSTTATASITATITTTAT
jgi:hypothetical protein